MDLKKYTSLVGALLFACITSAQGNTWTQKASLVSPIPRSFGCGFAIGTKGYVGGGYSGTQVFIGGFLKDFWEYDVATNVWTQKADLGGGPRGGMVSFSIGTKGYMGTGATGTTSFFTKDFWEYNPQTNLWTRKADLPGEARCSASGFTIGSKGYILCGRGGVNGPLADTWEYDPVPNAWLQKATFRGVARDEAGAFSIGTKGYLGCGQVNGNERPKDFWELDPVANTWTRKSDFAGALNRGKFGFSIGAKGYIGGGETSRETWEYDPSTDRWTQKANLGVSSVGNFNACRGASTFTIGSKGYVCSGDLLSTVTKRCRDLWEYDPAVNTWTEKRALGNLGGRRRVATGFNIGSKGYIGTGWDGYALIKDFWEFEPNGGNGVWSQKADFGGSARENAVGFSVGTKGYIGTGADATGQRQDFWEYDPGTNTWTQKADFGGGARQCAVGFGIGAKGYIGTGRVGKTTLKNDFWEYSPGSNTWVQKANFGGAARQAAAAFTIGGKGYIGTGSTPAVAKDFWAYDPVSNSWTRTVDFGGSARMEAVGFTAGMKGYIAMGSSTGSDALGDVWEFDPNSGAWTERANFTGSNRRTGIGFTTGSKGYVGTGLSSTAYLDDLWEYTPPTACSATPIRLTLNTDSKGFETSWDIVVAGENNPVCNGSRYGSVITVNEVCCLLGGKYDLRVFDAGNDGISTGGFMLSNDFNGERIIDNLANGGFTSVSRAPVSFTLPLGPNRLVSASCDQMSLTKTSVIQAVIDPRVTAQLTASPSNSGYEFEFFDPIGGVGGFTRVVFQSISTPGSALASNTTVPVGERPAYLKLSAVGTGNAALPIGKLLNVRVRVRINGVTSNHGPVCRLKVVS